jgi:hypothetical protein
MAVNGQPHPVTGSKVVLTTARLDHRPENCKADNPKAMCQRCHNSYDRHLRKLTRWMMLRDERQMDLVEWLDEQAPRVG